jgi:hypothetical protein
LPRDDARTCTHREALIPEVDVGRRVAILEAIPALRNAPELVDENGVLQDGEAVYPYVADFHIALYRCLEYGLLPIYPPLLRDGYDPPPQVDKVVTIRTNAGVVIYSDIDFTELRLPELARGSYRGLFIGQRFARSVSQESICWLIGQW